MNVLANFILVEIALIAVFLLTLGLIAFIIFNKGPFVDWLLSGFRPPKKVEPKRVDPPAGESN